MARIPVEESDDGSRMQLSDLSNTKDLNSSPRPKVVFLPSVEKVEYECSPPSSAEVETNSGIPNSGRKEYKKSGMPQDTAGRVARPLSAGGRLQQSFDNLDTVDGPHKKRRRPVSAVHKKKSTEPSIKVQYPRPAAPTRTSKVRRNIRSTPAQTRAAEAALTYMMSGIDDLQKRKSGWGW